MQAPAGPFPRADAAPNQPQGRSWKHCVASAHGRSTPGSENGRFWGGEAILRPYLHWQCQLGTVPFTVPYLTVYTVPIFKNTVKNVLTVPYRITVHRTVHRTATALIISSYHMGHTVIFRWDVVFQASHANNHSRPNLHVIKLRLSCMDRVYVQVVLGTKSQRVKKPSGAGFRPSLQPSWFPLIFPFLFAVEELYGTRYQSGTFSLIYVGSGFHCLRSFFIFFSWAHTVVLTVRGHGHLTRTYYYAYSYDWPEPYLYTISNRIFDEIPAKHTIYKQYVSIWYWQTLQTTKLPV
jgi:hypothetical protein